MLDALKNSFAGHLHMPHSVMIEHGIHAITFEGTGKSKKDSELQQTVTSTLGLMERLVRAFDQVDEQLHAGYFFYILTANTHFVSNSLFVYPVVLILLSFVLPVVIDFTDREDSTETFGQELKIVSLYYALGFILIWLPKQGTCASHSQNHSFELLIGLGILLVGLILAFIIGGKQISIRHLKCVNWFVLAVLTGSLVIYAFPIVLLNVIFLFPLVHYS
jgi:hypothetical protein